MRANFLISYNHTNEGEELLIAALDLNPELCSTIEEGDDFVPSRESEPYKKFLANRQEKMYTTMTEAKWVGDSSEMDRGESKPLVVLAKGRHSKEARDVAANALQSAGWDEFDLGVFSVAHQDGLKGMGAAAHQAWESAEENGSHILVFFD